jgi:hypothetical protein
VSKTCIDWALSPLTEMCSPTCWDGVNLDSPNHREHVAYPETGTFESGGKCPATHPVRLPQILLETVWDTKAFNNKADWPADGSQVSLYLILILT